ncbi:hypothetical protein ES676_10235 [Bizionia saleffrena]|uniref:Uncharacterized protein n=1 Tax=Bizionia saleffrena TaxID=291189 RepID=A0A8H2QIZ3_9FLAO|nr:hypothetical protein [Bizionia saleffrena]TYB73124.1 hypothetical protein ES676_10235 [Bizionia saleffrena]
MRKYGKLVVFTIFILFVSAYLYRFTPRRIEFLGHYDRVFAHRVNSLEKQKEALRYFNGIEFDLGYTSETDVLDISHSPIESIGLTFETYFNQIETNEFPFLWLDIKKLDSTNSEAIFFKLNTLFEARNYPKNKILIETRSPNGLPKFSFAGYNTSYYLKPKLHKRSPEELEREIKDIQSVLIEQPKIGISASYEDYKIMRTNFPEKTKYLWVLTSAYRPQFRKLHTILNDTTVAVVLSNFKSFKGSL